MNLSSSLEDYLETILDLKRSKGIVRITDISGMLDVEKSSANFAVKKLKNLKLVEHERYEDIRLTRKGEDEAKRLKTKRVLLRNLLQNYLGVSAPQAEKDACRIEHVIGKETQSRLETLLSFLENNPLFDRENFLRQLDHYSETGEIIQTEATQ